MKKLNAVIFALLVSISAPTLAEGNSGEMIQGIVDKVKKVVTEEGGSLSPEKLDDRLLTIIKPAFDFNEMSRRSLGANWNKANKEEKDEFIELFSELLAKNYLKQIRDNAKDSEFTIISTSEEGIRSLVQSKIKTPKEEIKIDYRLYNKKGDWKVYDVVIENIGLVSNYRSEFSGIVRRDGMQGLIKQLRSKINE
jgi:phospholipid transport system substrate-binding protein